MKKRLSVGWRILFNCITILVAAVLFIRMYYPDAVKLLSGDGNKNTELSGYLGKPLMVCAEELDVEFYGSGNNTYSVRQQVSLRESKRLFTCTVDENGTIIRILLRDSGRAGYTLFGLSSEDNGASGERLLDSAGTVKIEDGVWKAPNQADGIFLSNTGWVYERDSSALQQSVTDTAIAASISYQFNTSVGFYDLGNGQVLEYCHPNFTQLAYEADQGTDLAESEQVKALGGQYVYLTGRIGAVYSNGRIEVESSYTLSNGEEHREEFAITVAEDQDSILGELAEGSRIALYGKIATSYSFFKELEDVIIISVDGVSLEIPQIRSTSSGIHSCSIENGSAILQPAYETFTYIPCTVDDIDHDRSENESRATEKYQGQFWEVTGQLREFSNGSHIKLASIYEEDYWLQGELWCTFDNPYNAQALSTLNNGDYVTVKGYFPRNMDYLNLTVFEISPSDYTPPTEPLETTVPWEEPSLEYSSELLTQQEWTNLIVGTYLIQDLGLFFDLTYDPDILSNDPGFTPYCISISDSYQNPQTGEWIRNEGELSGYADSFDIWGYEGIMRFNFPVMDDAYEAYLELDFILSNRGTVCYANLHMLYNYGSGEELYADKLY